ncbi:hypothetical protein CEXT_465871 [Caerostris extrusa]|uniref:Uncharacterized protein n=1 Tax=Caerostris extrusa TaxID=172846 RepID=A0AAV4PY32_CAEEX|nr:hypothetical protein CEXT_465871 [Caerostris extrusa]
MIKNDPLCELSLVIKALSCGIVLRDLLLIRREVDGLNDFSEHIRSSLGRKVLAVIVDEKIINSQLIQIKDVACDFFGVFISFALPPLFSLKLPRDNEMFDDKCFERSRRCNKVVPLYDTLRTQVTINLLHSKTRAKSEAKFAAGHPSEDYTFPSFSHLPGCQTQSVTLYLSVGGNREEILPCIKTRCKRANCSASGPRYFIGQLFWHGIQSKRHLLPGSLTEVLTDNRYS